MKKKSFALIYAILYMALILLTITAITVLTISQQRTTRNSKGSIHAYQLAQSAIEAGIYKVRQSEPLKKQRFYVDGGSSEDIDIPKTLDTTKTSQGYYEVYFSGIHNNTVTGVGYGPWKGKDGFLTVTLQAVPVGISYKVSQIGNGG